MKKILIVDDELVILSGLSRTLRDLCGFHEEVRTVVSGREAIYEASCCFYDLCFLDISLPDINGLLVKEDINKVSPGTNIVLMSGKYSSDEFQKIAKGRGAFYMEKPFDFHQIRHVIKSTISESKNNDVTTGPFRKQAVNEKRNHRRNPLNKTLSFCITDCDYINILCGCLDISKSGVGIKTYYPLERGQVVFFNKGVSSKAGIVAWSNKDENNNFRAGLRFI
jgi:DNA-binding response OmpR family regulator